MRAIGEAKQPAKNLDHLAFKLLEQMRCHHLIHFLVVPVQLLVNLLRDGKRLELLRVAVLLLEHLDYVLFDAVLPLVEELEAALAGKGLVGLAECEVLQRIVLYCFHQGLWSVKSVFLHLRVD